MSTAVPFEDLLEAAQLGEARAFAELWSRHCGGVAAFVRGRGGHDVDEITSDVFLAAFTRIGDFVGDEVGFRCLLHTIARRRVVDEVRSRSRRVPVMSWAPDHDAPGDDDLEAGVVSSDEHRRLLALVDRLTPDQRDVILLRLVSDLSIEQVAGILGKRAGTVKSLQRRGLDALRRQLALQATAQQGLR